MNCDVSEAMEGLENELWWGKGKEGLENEMWRTWSDGKVGGFPIFTALPLDPNNAVLYFMDSLLGELSEKLVT